MCYHKSRWPFLAAFLVLCLGLEVRAESISIIASDNALVKRSQPDTDYIEAQEFLVQSNGSHDSSNVTFLRFDLSPLAAFVTIESASLDIFRVSTGDKNDVYVCALNDLANAGLGTTETSWSGNLTWTKRPDGTENLPNANTSGPSASRYFQKGGAFLASFDLTSALPGLLAGDTNGQLTLILYGSNDKSNKFASLANTGGNPVPTLNVTGAIPEPGTLALLAMALLGLAWYAWRKRPMKAGGSAP